MIGDPPTWLIFGGVIAALLGGVFVGDALGREVRIMVEDERRRRASKLSDELSGDRPAALQGDVIELPHEARGNKS